MMMLTIAYSTSPESAAISFFEDIYCGCKARKSACEGDTERWAPLFIQLLLSSTKSFRFVFGHRQAGKLMTATIFDMVASVRIIHPSAISTMSAAAV